MDPNPNESELSILLQRCAAGDKAAEGEVYTIAYQDLKRMARLFFSSETRMASLQPSMLVNEAYLRMPKPGEINWQGRKHFFAIAARAMRRVLVDAARARMAEKRPDSLHREELTPNMAISFADPDLVLMVDQALTRFSATDPRAVQVIEMRYFSNMTFDEIGSVLGLNPRTVKRDWDDGKTWLFAEINRAKGQA